MSEEHGPPAEAEPSPDRGLESLRPPTAEGFSDAITYSFGDLESSTFGVARIGISGVRQRLASGMALLYTGSEVSAVGLQGARETSATDWHELRAAGIETVIEQPLEAWTVAFAGDEGGFDLRFEALGVAAMIDPASETARVGGMHGYEHLCRVTGTVGVGSEVRPIACLGQRGHSWGAPDWGEMRLARTLSAWLDEGLAVSLTAVRPSGDNDHEAEAIEAVLFEAPGPLPRHVAEARLSTVYDESGRHQRAGLELWPQDDSDFPRRAAGEVICGTSLDLGRLRLDSAFFRWRMEGRDGVGRYDIVRRT